MANKDIYTYPDEDAPSAGSRFLMADAGATTTWGPEVLVDAVTGQLQLGGVEIGDTGWRDVTADLVNGWTGGAVKVRRCGEIVYVQATSLNGTSQTNDILYVSPTGFRAWATIIGVGRTNTGVDRFSRTTTDGSVYLDGDSAAEYFSLSYPTDDAWPATLPGT